MKKNIIIFTLLLFVFVAKAQVITLDFPKFAGKTYEFIIFQGSKAIKAQEGTIPEDGKFKLEVPVQYAPYTGMSRWLLTNSEQGGGLDMSIPGYGFSISCQEEIPSEANIIYTGYDPVNELNHLFTKQMKISEKNGIMLQAMKSYGKDHKLYDVFNSEFNLQAKNYEDFQKSLSQNSNYGAKFLPIVNILNGKGPKLFEDNEDNFREIIHYITYDLDFDVLYTSGHWDTIIETWGQLQKDFLKDDNAFYQDFLTLTNRVTKPKIYTEFTEKLTNTLVAAGMDAKIDLIAPIVLGSGKITNYTGKLDIYQKALIGAQAPNIFIIEHVGKVEDHIHQTRVLQSKDFAKGKYKKTAIIFYQSGCGPCENLMGQLPGNYKLLKDKGVRVISISADSNPDVFKNSSSSYPWTDKYCDYEGIKGVNFTNYAVSGTPTIYLINKKGNIESRMFALEELLDKIK